MKEIHDLGRQYGFKIIEDAAHAIGAKYQDESVGNCRYSDITVFSFHPVKIITTGEGGCALTNNKHLARKMTLYRSHGITRDSKEMIHASPEGWYYEQICLGFNYRMSDIQASLGISQLERLDQYVKRRFEIANWYDEKINLDILHPLARRNNRKSSHHLYVVQSKNKTERDTLYQHLIESDVYVNLHYIPVYHHPHYNININLPGAEQYFRTAISLPIFPTIEKKDLIYIMKNILEVCL
jgi:dTDP-4-amino-4,6-dideoxygalactose transaminase